MAPETLRLGPLTCYAQWTLKMAIGNLGCEIHQDQDLYTNLTQCAILHAQINSMWARFPGVKLDFGVCGTASSNQTCEFVSAPGYLFLPHWEKVPSPVGKDEFIALMVYWRAQQWPNRDHWHNTVCRWAKLWLPNGQTA